MAYVCVREPGRVSFTVEVGETLLIGRDVGNHLVLSDRHASRQHARITSEGAGFVLLDLGSTHGTFVRGQRVERAPLDDGDVVQIGNVLLTFGTGAQARSLTMSRIDAGEPGRGQGDTARRLRLLYQVSRAVGALGDPEQLVGKMLEAILDVLGCERGLVGLSDGSAGAARRITRARRPGPSTDDIVVSRALLDAMLVRRENVLVRPEDATLAASMARHGVRSAMGAPLCTGERVLGFIYVDDCTRKDHFSDEEHDFLIALAHLTAAALAQAHEQARAAALAAALREANAVPDLIGTSEPMQRLGERIGRYARAGSTSVLIRGESGTGKELVAQALHSLSPRADQPFVAVNCAAIPDTLIESELFGHTRGAFTSAARERRGRFALAHGGTLFLDEVGDLSLAAQAKLLRAIEEGEIQPLGAETPLRVDVRVISATHKDLTAEIAEGRFRADLYYRLVVGELHVPPLRARGDDVILLAETFLGRAAGAGGKRTFSPAAYEALRRYDWPGNVRQLHNEVERALLLADGATVELEDLRARLGTSAATPRLPALGLAARFAQLDETERQLVADALTQARGNLSEAARLLGISRIMLKRRVDRFGIRPGEGEGSQGEGEGSARP